MLMTKSIVIIKAVSFNLLCLKRIRHPSPAFDKSPAIAAPKLIEPFIKNIVMAIDVAQFGIKPKNAINVGSKNCTLPSIVCKNAC